MEMTLPKGSRVALCSDHAGYQLKEHLKALLESLGYTTVDFGTDSEASCDYPDYAHPAAEAVSTGDCAFGVAMCGTGNGISMTLNKHQAVRAALCWEPELARLARAHNNANILVMPARFISAATADAILGAFLETPFEGGRHERRIEKIPARHC
ncbi:MAG: ribose 5-phosphate isomerase B [Clostridium sp.]|nr:ribose 5-phosphate isomerase B [Clostridium sp.]